MLTQDWLADLLPALPALIVDVGAGTGHDAGGFAAADDRWCPAL
ncbi:MAG: hypothetical protein ACRYHQ_33805 [Janthinobacterium lividum]